MEGDNWCGYWIIEIGAIVVVVGIVQFEMEAIGLSATKSIVFCATTRIVLFAMKGINWFLCNQTNACAIDLLSD